MSRSLSSKVTAETYRLPHQRFLHEIDIPNEAGEQRTQRQKHGNAVGTQRVAVRHRMRNKRRPKSHQNSGDHAGDNALLRYRAACAGQAAVRFAVEDHGDERAHHAGREQCSITLGLQDVA